MEVPAIASEAISRGKPVRLTPAISAGTAWWEYGPSISGNPSVIATNQPTIVAGDLPYTGLYSTGGGESVTFGGNGDSALQNLTTTSSGITAGTVYFSFVFQLTDITVLDTNGTYFTALNNLQSHNSTFNTPAALAARVLVRRSGNGFNVGLQEGGANGSTGFNTAWGSAVFFCEQQYSGGGELYFCHRGRQ